MKKLTEGYVAYILNERELVLNIGSKSGVSIGMKLRSYHVNLQQFLTQLQGKSSARLIVKK